MTEESFSASEAELSMRDMLDENPRVGPARQGPRRFWTMREIAIVKEHYPTGGMPACLPLLPGRSAATIYQKAKALGIGLLNKEGRFRQRQLWTFTPQMDDAIRQVYHADPAIGALKALARTLGRPRSVVSSRARKLGLIVPRFNAPPWTDPEREIVRANFTAHPGTIRRKLKAAGFQRTETAILLVRKRFGRQPEDDSGALGASEVAETFGVTRDTVARWLDKGLLKGRRIKSHTAPESATPHDRAHWRIGRAELKAFVMGNVAIVDFRKVDKFWLVDLLTDPHVRAIVRLG